MPRQTIATPDISEQHTDRVCDCASHPSDPLFSAGIAGVADKRGTKSGVLAGVRLNLWRLEAVIKGLQNLYTGVRFSPAPPCIALNGRRREVLRLRSGFRLAARTPPKRLKFDSPPRLYALPRT